MSLGKTIFGWRDVLTLLLTMVVSVVLIFTNQGASLGGLQIATLYVIGKLNKPIMRIKSYSVTLEENTKLRHQNAYLQIENSRLREAFLENDRLRKLLELKSVDSLDCLPVKIVGRGMVGSVASIILDAGSENGSQKNMPIIAPSGLVGKIYLVGKKSSLGQTLLDRNFRVSARVQRTRVEGIVRNEGGALCKLSEVPFGSEVNVNDIIITSGYSAIFPAGLRIGTVTSVDEKSSGLLISVSLKPGVDFFRLEDVLVIRNFPRKREFNIE